MAKSVALNPALGAMFYCTILKVVILTILVLYNLQDFCDFRYDFICIPLVHPRFRREFIAGPAKTRPGAFTRSDMLLSSQGMRILKETL